jgi:L-lactate dehydrogenase complex protein LldG
MSGNELYEKFRARVVAVDAECYRVTNKEELETLLTEALKKRGTAKTVAFESDLTRSLGIQGIVTAAGSEFITEDIRRQIPQATVGITEMRWGVAALGSMVQYAPQVDNRLCSTLVDTHIAFLQAENILPDLDDAVAKIAAEELLPNYVGFITGPSRSSDIERVLTIGVHGPLEVIVIVIDEEGGR